MSDFAEGGHVTCVKHFRAVEGLEGPEYPSEVPELGGFE